MKTIHSIGIFTFLMLLVGCGTSVGSGSATSNLSGVVSEDTAPYALLELATGKVTWFVALPAGDPDLTKTTHMAFRRVTVSGEHDALVGVFEVTQAQWQMLDTTPGPLPWASVPNGVCAAATSIGPKRPAFNLEFEYASSVVDGYAPGKARLTLPTDSQWTAACGVSTGWWWGSAANPTVFQAQLAANSIVRESILSTARMSTIPGVDSAGPVDVGSCNPSPQGFFDIHGNVWEIIAGGDHAKGGCWRDSAWQSRAEVSLTNIEGYHGRMDYALVGMRLVLVP